MGAGYVHRCDHCGYSVCTAGPWEFHGEVTGRRNPHVASAALGASRHSAHGLAGALYCPDCDTVSEVVLGECEEKPAREPAAVWLAGVEPGDEPSQTAVKCPQCGGEHLVLGPESEWEVYCPRCREGQLVGEIECVP